MALNITINKTTVAASYPAGSTVATAVASGGTTPYTYSLATGGDYFSIDASTGVVTTKALMDVSSIQSFSVTVTDSNSTPESITSGVVYPNIQAAQQSKFNKSNVIYKIVNDIDLGNAVLTIPANCTLNFQGGGRITNGSIILNNTALSNIVELADGITASVSGSFRKGQILWFDDTEKPKVWNGSQWLNLGGALFRNNGNKLEISYDDGSSWEAISDYIAAYFRYVDLGSGIGKIQISRDNTSWEDLSPEFTNNLKIKGYVTTTGNLPTNAVQGDIYGVGPTYDPSDIEQTNPIYQLYVKDSTGWVNNGRFTSIAAGVVQDAGDSETEIISQNFLSNNTFLNRKIITNIDDLNNITEIGIFVWMSNSIPINSPIAQSGMMIVYPYYRTNNTPAENPIVKNTQIVITSANKIYMRSSTIETGYTEWVELVKSEDLLETLHNRSYLSSTDDLNDKGRMGVYSWGSNSVPINSPVKGYGQCVVIPYFLGESMSGAFQYVCSKDTMYFRYRAISGWTPWNKTFGTNKLNYDSTTDNLGYKLVLKDNDDLDNCIQTGTYSWVASTAIINSPFNTGGICLTFPAYGVSSNVAYRIVQLAIGYNNQFYLRFKLSSGWNGWTNVLGGSSGGGGSSSSPEENKIRAFVNKCLTKWTPLGNIPKNTVGTNYYTGTIEGVPYSSIFTYGDDIHYHRNLSTFYSAVKNPASILYTKGYGGNTHTGAYYGTVCSSFVNYLCGQKIYYITSEMEKVLEKIDYIDIEQLNVGDVLLTEGHCKIITSVSVNEKGEYSITITEQAGSNLQELSYDQAGFERILDGTDPHDRHVYTLGRFPNQTIKILPKIEYSENVISEYGDKTYFNIGDDIFVYIASGNILTIENDGNTTNVALNTLSSKTVGDNIMYNVKSILNHVGSYNLYVEGDIIKANLIVVDTGDVILSNKQVTISGYSNNITPSWYNVVMVIEDTGTTYSHFPAPEGYIGAWASLCKDEINSDTFTIKTNESVESAYGYYVRCYYDTEFGQVYKDSNLIVK